MRKDHKRLLCLVLTAVMVLGMVPAVTAAEYQGAEVYDHVLDTYEENYQGTISFNANGTAKLTGEEWYDQPEIIGINRERAKSQFYSYHSVQAALDAEKSAMDDIGPESSEYYQILSRRDWDFALVETPAEAREKDAEYLLDPNYDGEGFQKEYVPQAWQTYRNEDGTFKYFDEPIYINQVFPWVQWEQPNYSDPAAPTVYNPVGYYRTSFTTPTNWDGREIFISLQSVESAYYLYINGKAVGYSTDSYSAHDFNITDYLNPAGEENVLTMKVFRWSIASWVENQDYIRESGIYRDVYLYAKDEVEIRDFFFKTAFEDRTSEDSDVDVTVETDIRGLHNVSDGTYTLKTYIVDNDGNTVAAAEDQTVTIGASAGKTAAQVLSDKGTTVTTTMTVTNPDKWFPDSPNLYSLVLELSKGDQVLEAVVERVGFREIYKVDINDAGQEQMQITGRQMVLRGVNRHDADTETGRALTYEDYLTDLLLMKQNNLNAVRTSHYPNDRVLYDLADELGIYVCAEANVESHRAATQGIKVPSGTGSGLPEWVPTILDRVATNLEMYKNNPSVVIWSLGNEATYSYNALNDDYSFWVASMYLLARDPSRLRKYERESDGYYGHSYTKAEGADPWSVDVRKNNIVDVQSTQYALPNYAESYSGQMPFIHSEYNHAMGQAYGNAKDHWDAIRSNDAANGGFIWDYIDQGIRTVRIDEDGNVSEFIGYGGDWIDTVQNDDAFTGNGLLFSDRTESPKMAEAKKVHQQVSFYMEDLTAQPGENVTVVVVNEFESTDLSNYEITWTLTQDGLTEIASGTLDISTGHLIGKELQSAANTELVNIQIPADLEAQAGSDYLLDFSVKLKTATNWAEAGHEIAYEQFELSFDNAADREAMNTSKAFESIKKSGDEMTLTGTTDDGLPFEITLNTALGTIQTYELNGEVVMSAGPEQSYYRAQTYNDTTVAYIGALKNAGDPENMDDVTASVSVSEDDTKVMMAMSGTMTVAATSLMAYQIYGNGEIVVLSQFIPNENFAPSGLPKIGSRLEINGDYDNLTYYGRGPQETYVDRKSGARVGVYTETVYDPNDPMAEDSNWIGKKMTKPQENGNHTDVRWTALTNDAGIGLMVSSDDLVQMSAVHYTAEELNSGTYNSETYGHPYEVVHREQIVWSIDLHQHGVADTAFMGHIPLDGYRFATDKSYSYSYRITPIQTSDAETLMEKSNQSYEVPTSSYPITGISINGTPVSGFDVNSSTGASYTLGAEENITAESVTVEGTTDFTVTFNEDGTMTVAALNNYGQEYAYVIQLAREGNALPNTVFGNTKVDNYYYGQDSSKMIDGNTGTIWHSNWSITTPMSDLWFMVELNEATDINGVMYLPRTDSNNFNGAFGEHEIYVSDKSITELGPDSADWKLVGTGTWAKGSGWKSTALPEVVNAKSIMIKPVTTYGDTENAWGSCAEFRVTTGTEVVDPTVELEESYTYNGEPVCPDPVVTVDGMRLIRGVDYTVTYADNEGPSGTGKLTVNFKGAFYGEAVEKTFSIVEGEKYTVNVVGGTADMTEAYAGQIVTITAGEPAENTMFDHWAGTVDFDDESQSTTTFVMPAADVTVTAEYVEAYWVTVVGGYLDEEGTITSMQVKPGTTLTLYADIPEGQLFEIWNNDGEGNYVVDQARNPALTHPLPARDITFTASFKNDPEFFKVLDELPDHAYMDYPFNAPGKLLVNLGGEEVYGNVVWNAEDLAEIRAGELLDVITLRGTVAGHEIETEVTVVPKLVYFLDQGAERFDNEKLLTILKYNQILNGTATDGAYSAETGWGYTNPEHEVESHADYGTDIYSTILCMTDSKGESEDGRGKPLVYQFDNLEAGKAYTVYIGYKNIWYQTTYQRNATIELIVNGQVIATIDKNLNVQEGTYFALSGVMPEGQTSLTVKLTPKENNNANNDVLVSFMAIVEDAPETHTVTFEGADVEAQDVAHGDQAVQPADPEKDGYVFGGWYTDAACTTAYDFSAPVTQDMILYAKWTEEEEPVYHTVTIDGEAIQVLDGQTVTKPADPVKEGYKFLGWYVGDEQYDFAQPVHGDITIVSKWEKVEEPSEPSEPSESTEPSEGTDPTDPTVPGTSDLDLIPVLILALLAAATTTVLVLRKRSWIK